MTVTRRNFLQLAGTGAAAVAVAVPSLACAQAYPARPVRVIVPFAPGGVDVVMRLLAPKLSQSLGQQFFVENVGGGGGSIGTVQATHAAPDGYTILFAASAFVMFPAVHGKSSYRPLEDFAPITEIATASMVLLINPSVKATSVKELVALMRADPRQFSFASAGVGTPPHLTGELFRQSLGLDLVHVPYHSGGEAVGSVIAGHTPICFAAAGPAVAQVTAGKLRALAVAAASRLPALPDVSTMAEAGYPGVEGEVWCGILVPVKTPADMIARLHTEVIKVLGQPEIKARLIAIGYTPVGNAPAEFGRQISNELTKWEKVAREAHIKA
jgi:tripartite-type tricarboxylate transporter receptor subunit TctC